jgi:hypothetical protein
VQLDLHLKGATMNRNSPWRLAAISAFLLAATLSGLAAPAHKQTFTGEVGDAMCGSKHMEGTPAECTRSCVAHGSKFALIVGEKIYTLDTNNQEALKTLDRQAGKNATVTGTLNGDTIEVLSVSAK